MDSVIETERLILTPVTLEDANAYELGYDLNLQYWINGFATEASKVMIQCAYQTLNARDFVATHATVVS